jgi:kynurenine formamidase
MTTVDTRFAARTVSLEELEATAKKWRTWGRWGPEDELGAANLLTPDVVAAALAVPRRGAVFSLSLPLDASGPMTGRNGRVNPQHLMLRQGGDIAQAGSAGFDYTDDVLYMPLQASTQWDALCHIFYQGRAYNDRGTHTVTNAGALRNGITNLSDRCLSRGVLLDIPRWAGLDWLEPGATIQAEHLEQCAADQGVEVRTGDIVLVRTGQLAQVRARGSWGDYAGGPAPGLGVSAADFLCPRGVVAVATDTWGIEAMPYETGPLRAPLHIVLLVNAGVHIGEIWDLEALAADCAADGLYEFLLCAPPLNITGAVGSPVNPIAVK